MCLGDRKKLTVSENLMVLIEMIQGYAPQAIYDTSYSSLRPLLERVWPSEQQTEARGWHRERAGKYSTGAAIETTNEAQFLRYSRLRNYLIFNTAGER
jgi:hypothetical protein